ncbi:MAG: acetate kinase [Bacillota bacterium]|nr:acetate kinase [Bacillota bacterium]
MKFQLINMVNEDVVAKGNVERIGIEGSFMKYQPGDGDKITVEKDLKNHKEAMKIVIDALLDPKTGVIKNVDEITAVGHRVVHGGEFFSGSVVIDDAVIKALEDCIELAPIHNPPNLMGIQACKEIMPNTPMVGVFDTAFHHSIPKHAYMYGLPYEVYEKYKVRKFGFHGTSHKYVYYRLAEIMGKDPNNFKVITCHLGNGSSITAIKNGESIDTSLGYTPLAGLPMGTRCGDIDPAIVPFLMEKEGLSTKEINDLMNKKSGVLGLSGVSNDFRDLEEAAEKGNERAQLALDVFIYSVKKFISTYVGILNGVDAVVFTAGIGENDGYVREKAVEGLDYLGIAIDKDKNNVRGKEVDISKDGAKVKTFIVPTNEELMIARETQKLVK